MRQHAALKGHALICKELLTHGAQVDAIALDGWTPLLKAANGGHAKVVKLLIQHGANPNTRTAPGSTPQANLTAYEIAQQQGCFSIHTLSLHVEAYSSLFKGLRMLFKQ